MNSLKLFKGSCHCKAVKFEVLASDEVTVWVCNCSVCQMRKNYHFIVPRSQMKEIIGADQLTTYTFGTHTAKHMFCRVCGISPFYIPRSNPDGYAITLDCLELDCRPAKIHMKMYDGRNWERSFEETGIKSETKR
jgi:hypothetical protein